MIRRFLEIWRWRRAEARRLKRKKALELRLLALHMNKTTNEGSALR